LEKVTIENATLYHGDCREIIDALTFDSIVTDPPYGIGKWQNKFGSKSLGSGGTWATKDIYKEIDWDDEAPDLTFLLEKNVPTMVFGGNYFSLPPSRKWIVWDKGGTHFRKTFAEVELCWCSFDGNARKIECMPTFRRGWAHQNNEKVHPTQKPVAVMQYCISELPKGYGNIVIDPFMGSGTTGVACVQMGRAFIGIEQNKKYFDIACERLTRAVEKHKNQFPAVREMVEQKQLFTEKTT
jgi:site-specific DNA-methyltransferase (adenine-specific)/modification methylase